MLQIEELITGPPEESENNNAVPTTIDVVTLEPETKEVEKDYAFNSTSRVRLKFKNSFETIHRARKRRISSAHLNFGKIWNRFKLLSLSLN